MKRSSAELKRIARENLKGRYGIPMGTMVVGNLICNIPLTLFSWVTRGSAMGVVIYYIASLILSALSGVFVAGRIYIGLQMGRGRQYQFADMFYPFRGRADRYILAALLQAVIYLVLRIPSYAMQTLLYRNVSAALLWGLGVATLAGMVVTIFLQLLFSQVYMLLLDHQELGVLDGFRQSAGMMRGNKGRLFYITLSFLGWVLLAICSCGIGMLWIMPYITQTQVSFYRDLTGELEQPVMPGYGDPQMQDLGVMWG